MIKVSLISLGCAKNLVDSEIMVGHLHQAGMSVVPDAEKAARADLVIENMGDLETLKARVAGIWAQLDAESRCKSPASDSEGAPTATIPRTPVH